MKTAVGAGDIDRFGKEPAAVRRLVLSWLMAAAVTSFLASAGFLRGGLWGNAFAFVGSAVAVVSLGFAVVMAAEGQLSVIELDSGRIVERYGRRIKRNRSLADVVSLSTIQVGRSPFDDLWSIHFSDQTAMVFRGDVRDLDRLARLIEERTGLTFETLIVRRRVSG